MLIEELAYVLRPHWNRSQTKQIGFDVRFEGPLPERVRTDSLRLNPILTNLVSHSHGMLNVLVRDTGIGIASGERERVFEPYRQVNPAGTDRERGVRFARASKRPRN